MQFDACGPCEIQSLQLLHVIKTILIVYCFIENNLEQRSFIILRLFVYYLKSNSLQNIAIETETGKYRRNFDTISIKGINNQ